jgi:hypothetical protein
MWSEEADGRRRRGDSPASPHAAAKTVHALKPLAANWMPCTVDLAEHPAAPKIEVLSGPEFFDSSFCPGHSRNHDWRSAKEGDDILGVYSSKILVCRQTLPTIWPTCQPKTRSLELDQD